MARILVIDDEERTRGLLCTALEMDGHEVHEGRHNEGLEALRATPPDLVITDLKTPEKGGLDAILALRREAPQLRVITVSGGGRNEANAADPLGAFASVRKPFEMSAMLETVKKALAA